MEENEKAKFLLENSKNQIINTEDIPTAHMSQARFRELENYKTYEDFYDFDSQREPFVELTLTLLVRGKMKDVYYLMKEGAEYVIVPRDK